MIEFKEFFKELILLIKLIHTRNERSGKLMHRLDRKDLEALLMASENYWKRKPNFSFSFSLKQSLSLVGDRHL